MIIKGEIAFLSENFTYIQKKKKRTIQILEFMSSIITLYGVQTKNI